MSERNPHQSDLILGGQNSPPTNAAILGGLAGVKQRLASESIAERLQALNNAVTYGDDGIELALRALSDNDDKVRRLGKRLLRDLLGEEGRIALFDLESLGYFKTFDDWRQEIYNSEIGITDPDNNAYVVSTNIVDRTLGTNPDIYDMSQLEYLLDDVCAYKLQALSFKIYYTQTYYPRETYKIYEQRLFAILRKFNNAQVHFHNLKALFIGDIYKYQYRKTKLHILDLIPILNAYPKLEILQVRGHIYTEALPASGISHESLQTLIIESNAANMCFIERLFSASFPALEYLELWGINQYINGQESSDMYRNIIYLLDKSLPNLKYLGLVSGEGMDEFVSCLVESPIIERVSMLNLSMGTLTDRGAKLLLECPSIDKLNTLDVSYNGITRDVVRRFSKLSCNVKLKSQRKIGKFGSRHRHDDLYVADRYDY